MRLLRLDLGPGYEPVEFHPLVTVVAGVDDSQREQIVRNIRRLARGSAVGVTGLIEERSHLLHLDGTKTIALSHVTTVDVVADVDDNQLKQAAATALQAEIDLLSRQVDIAAAQVEEVRARLDLTAKSQLARLRKELDLADQALDPSLKRQEHLTKVVETASEALVGRPEEELAALEAWHSYQDFLREHQSRATAVSDDLDRAQCSVEKARSEFEVAKREAVPTLLTGSEERRLFELEEQTEKKGWEPSGPEATERQALLDKVGVTNWTAYTIHRISPTAPQTKVDRLKEAEAVLVQSERKRSELSRELNADLVLVELGERRSRAFDLACGLLGVEPGDLPSDVAAVINKRHEDRVGDVESEMGQYVLAAIEKLKIEHPEDLTAKHAVLWAQEWLAGQQRNDHSRARNKLRREILDAERTLSAHNMAMASIDEVEDRAAESRSQIKAIHSAREQAQAGGFHHTAELLSYIRSVSDEALAEASQPVPIAVVGSLEKVDAHELLNSLEYIAQRVQVIVITDNPVAVQWAGSVGSQRALPTRVNQISRVEQPVVSPPG